MKTPYEKLGVRPAATSQEIKSSYRRLAKKYHPDVSKNNEQAEQFKEVAEAYALLANPSRRARYDETGKEQDEQHEADIAVAELQGLFLDVLQKIDYQLLDVIDVVRDSISESMPKFKAFKAEKIKLANKWRLAMTRLKCKDPAVNPLASALTNLIVDAEKSAAAADTRIETAGRMLVMLDLYEWTTDASPFNFNMITAHTNLHRPPMYGSDTF